MPLVVLVLVVVLLAFAPHAWARDWTRPVGGDVVEPFVYDRAAPFARGAHRGVDFAARPGERVRAPCAGVVSFAGRVPSRGAGVTIRCGALVATLVELRVARVARGARVGRGDVVGVTGAGHTAVSAGDRRPTRVAAVHLGARRAGDPFGYVDPISLVDAAPPSPLSPAPAPPRRPARRLQAPLAPARDAAGRVDSGPVPVAAWGGLALVAAGLPVGAMVRRRRRAPARGSGRVAVPR